MDETCTLYRHRGTRAVQRMVEFAPATGGLALWVAHRDLPDDADAPAAATDGHTIFYGKAFERLEPAVQTGVIAHEVLHIALRHPQRYLELRARLGDVDLGLFNTCADAIVNSTLGHLNWLQLPARSVDLETLLAHTQELHQSAEKSLLEWDVERLYRAIDNRRAASASTSDRPNQDGRRAGTGGLRDQQTRKSAPYGDPCGDGAHSMLRALIADLPRSRTPWEQVLRTRLARSLKPKPALSWSRPSRSYIANQGRSGRHRRMPWEPGSNGNLPVPRLALMVDVSGSIEGDLMQRFAREIEAISRRLEAGMLLVIGDDRVRHVERFEPGRVSLHNIEFTGGDDTDFTPLLEEADSYRPDIGVVLTDLEGPARFKPRWPVIWAVPEGCAVASQPFGRRLLLD